MCGTKNLDERGAERRRRRKKDHVMRWSSGHMRDLMKKKRINGSVQENGRVHTHTKGDEGN